LVVTGGGIPRPRVTAPVSHDTGGFLRWRVIVSRIVIMVRAAVGWKGVVGGAAVAFMPRSALVGHGRRTKGLALCGRGAVCKDRTVMSVADHGQEA
jgi:hypothetical protein